MALFVSVSRNHFCLFQGGTVGLLFVSMCIEEPVGVENDLNVAYSPTAIALLIRRTTRRGTRCGFMSWLTAVIAKLLYRSTVLGHMTD